MFTCSVFLTWPCFLEVTSRMARSLERQLLMINGIGVFTGLLLNYVKALKRTHKPAKGFYLATVFWGGCHTAYANCPCSRCIYALVVKTLFLFFSHVMPYCVFLYTADMWKCLWMLIFPATFTSGLSSIFLPCGAMLARYMLWPCVCLSQVGVLLKWLNTASHKHNCMIAQGL